MREGTGTGRDCGVHTNQSESWDPWRRQLQLVFLLVRHVCEPLTPYLSFELTAEVFLCAEAGLSCLTEPESPSTVKHVSHRPGLTGGWAGASRVKFAAAPTDKPNYLIVGEDQDWALGYSEEKYVGGVKVMLSGLRCLDRLSSTVVESSCCGTGALDRVGGRPKKEDYLQVLQLHLMLSMLSVRSEDGYIFFQRTRSRRWNYQSAA